MLAKSTRFTMNLLFELASPLLKRLSEFNTRMLERLLTWEDYD